MNMDGLECKRCKEPDTFEVFCKRCEHVVFSRTNALIARSHEAKKKAEEICEQLGEDALGTLTKLADEVTDGELYQAFRRDSISEPSCRAKYGLCIKLFKLEDERLGYAELAEMSCRVPYEDNYIEDEVCGMLSQLARAEATQDYRTQ